MTSTILGTYKVVVYTIDQQDGYYTKTDSQPELYPVLRMPYKLKRERAWQQEIQVNAAEIIRSKEKKKNGAYKFLTGIQPSGFDHWMIGNDFEMVNGVKKTSAIIFSFSKDNSRMVIYYFPRWDKPTSDLRIRWANYLIPELKKRSY